MPVLEPVSDQNATPAAKEIFEQLHSKLKMVPNIFRTMAHAPDVLGATLSSAASFKDGLDPFGFDFHGFGPGAVSTAGDAGAISGSPYALFRSSIGWKASVPSSAAMRCPESGQSVATAS